VKPKRERRQSRSRTTSNSQHAQKIVQGLTILRDEVGAAIAELEAEEAKHHNRIEVLRAAEMAAPRKRAFYFRMARLIHEGGAGPEIVAHWLPRLTPDAIHKITNALEATEKAVDRGGLKAVKAYLAARREKGDKLKREDIVDHYRRLYPGHRVPKPESSSKTLRRKQLWRGKRGAPRKEKSDKSA